jgi:hypothetical protein
MAIRVARFRARAGEIDPGCDHSVHLVLHAWNTLTRVSLETYQFANAMLFVIRSDVIISNSALMIK